MRTVKFPAVTDANLNPGNLLAQCLNPPNGGGINVTEMALRLPIAQKLRVANGKVKLEDAEWEKLKKCIEDTQFVLLSEDIYSVCMAVIEAEPDKEEKRHGAERQ